MTPPFERASAMSISQEPRLTISTRSGLRDRMHGAWWPTSDSVVHELPPMLAAAARMVPAIVSVSLNRDEWPDAPLRYRALATRSPLVTWYGLKEPHLAVLQCAGRLKFVLLVVPPDAPADAAATLFSMACVPGNASTTTSMLATAGLSPAS